jgi:hypothetical protein
MICSTSSTAGAWPGNVCCRGPVAMRSRTMASQRRHRSGVAPSKDGGGRDGRVLASALGRRPSEGRTLQAPVPRFARSRALSAAWVAPGSRLSEYAQADEHRCSCARKHRQRQPARGRRHCALLAIGTVDDVAPSQPEHAEHKTCRNDRLQDQPAGRPSLGKLDFFGRPLLGLVFGR